MASVSWLQICQPQRSQALTGMSARQEMRPRSVSCRSAIRRLLFLMRPILQKSQHFSFCECTIFFPPLVSYVSKLVFPRPLAGMCEIVHTAATTSSAASGASGASIRPAPAPSLCAGSGRCTFPAGPRTCAPTIARGHWKRRRRNSRSAGASGRRGPSWKRCPRIRAAGEKKPRRSGAEVRICRVPRVISGTSNHTRLPKQLRLLHCRSRAPHTPLSLRAPDSAPSLGRADKPVSSRTINEEVESVMAC